MGKEEPGRIEEGVRKFKQGVAKEFLEEKIIIFGSAARGRMKKDSDVDIIVVSRKYGRKHVFGITPKLYGAWHERQKIDYPVDILLFNTKEFEELKKEVSSSAKL
jgi:predicted nucleotidyltransferase